MKLNKEAKNKLEKIKSEIKPDVEDVVEEVVDTVSEEKPKRKLRPHELDEYEMVEVMNLTTGKHWVRMPEKAVSQGNPPYEYIFEPDGYGSTFGEIKYMELGLIRALAMYSKDSFKNGKLKLLDKEYAEILGIDYDNTLTMTPSEFDALFAKDTDEVIKLYDNSNRKMQRKLERVFLIKYSKDEFKKSKADVLISHFNVKV